MRTIERAMSVLEAFTQTEPSMPLHVIATRIKLSKPTTFRLINCLVDLGYLVRLSTQDYCLSMKILHLAGQVRGTLSIREVAHETMQKLARQTDETIALNMVDGFDRVCIDAVDSSSRLVSVMRPGDRAPLGVGASTKVLLAYLPRNEISDALDNLSRKRKINKTKLRAELQQIRDRGYAITHGEVTLGNVAVAAPIFDADGRVRYSISLSCPAFRYEPRKQEFLQLVIKGAAEISRRNGCAVAAARKSR
jgi:DNA-binding IclR family transcriptional regulator